MNLIGEHIDYEGYSVLPMALALDTIVAVKVDAGSDRLVVSNTNPEYTTKEFSTDPSQQVDTASLHWTNYCMCGYKGVFDFLGEAGRPLPETIGLKIMVDGRVPTGSGLSSSSALTCATAVAARWLLTTSRSQKQKWPTSPASARGTVGHNLVAWIRRLASWVKSESPNLLISIQCVPVTSNCRRDRRFSSATALLSATRRRRHTSATTSASWSVDYFHRPCHGARRRSSRGP